MNKRLKSILSILVPLLGVVFVFFTFYFDRGLYDALMCFSDPQFKDFVLVGFFLSLLLYCFFEFVINLFDVLIDLIRRIIHKRNNRHAPPPDPEHR